ncbi:hypothetical protein CRE_16837 [Caenorhabditis remanei]|uniref:G-protein coupled receptors family 1 profile domain-containing protein n=2 Tax=Caenorhabditis remanei TaxID=31234 RepID=E3MS97_CAERE|nr:hypothetical protein CRE_16837 [Caenorhabditis remanei]
MNSTFEPPTWGFKVYYGMSIVTIPLYSVILICLLRLRYVSKTYKTTFYSLLQQHCIADLASMIGYIALTPAREIPVIRQFYFENQEYYIAAATYNIIYVSLYIRCTGIVFLSLQRYLVITSPHSQITLKVQTASNWKIIVVYWITPILLSIVVLTDTSFYFNNVIEMTLIVDRAITQRNTLMALIVVSITCIVSSVAYGALFSFVRNNTVRLSKSLRRELHLAFQVLVLLLAFFTVLAFFASLNYFSQMQMTTQMYYLRGIYPMISGFLSYSNPYCILLLNRDLTGQVIKSVSCEGYKVSEAQVSGIRSNSTKQQNLISVQNGATAGTESTRRVAFA